MDKMNNQNFENQNDVEETKIETKMLFSKKTVIIGAAVVFVTLLAIILIIALGGNTGPKYEELKLKKTEIVTCKNNSWPIGGIIDFEENEISENSKIESKSSDESIAKYEDGNIVVGDKYGKATVTFTVEGKEASVTVKVESYLNYLKALAKEEGASGYDLCDFYAATWLIENLDKFKNPASVSVNDVWYVEDSVSKDEFNAGYLIMEIRAQNGFGGYGINHYKVTIYGIEEVTLEDNIPGISYKYNGKRLFTAGAYSLNKALQEYIEDNYK